MVREKRSARGSDEPQPQEEMTVIVLKFKGGSHSVHKAFDAVSQALSLLGPGGQSNNQNVVQRQPQQLPSAEGKVIHGEAKHLDEEFAADDSGEETPGSGNGKAKKSPATPKHGFLGEFNLSPDNVPSLKDYCAEKDPQNDTDKFLVASAWIQTHGGVNPFNGNHLFTCFRAMGWKTQADMVQPLRASKHKKSFYENPSRGEWRLTSIGLEAAENLKKE